MHARVSYDAKTAAVLQHLSAVDSVSMAVIQGLSLIHISEPTRQAEISYAVFCLKKKLSRTPIDIYVVFDQFEDEEFKN